MPRKRKKQKEVVVISPLLKELGIHNIPILSVKINRCIQAHRITRLEDFSNYCENDFRKVPDSGPASVNRLIEALTDRGIYLRGMKK